MKPSRRLAAKGARIKRTGRSYGQKLADGNMMYGPGCCPHRLYSSPSDPVVRVKGKGSNKRPRQKYRYK